MFRSPLQRPPSMIPFPQVAALGGCPVMTLDFIDYDGIFSVVQCVARDLPFVVVTGILLDDDWSPCVMISREATFERVTWPMAVQQALPLTLIVSTPSLPRPRPRRIVISTLQGDHEFLRLDLWEKAHGAEESLR